MKKLNDCVGVSLSSAAGFNGVATGRFTGRFTGRVRLTGLITGLDTGQLGTNT